MTIIEAAKISGYHPNHIRRLLRAGKIKARKWGKLTWMISQESLLDYIKNSKAQGDKRGPKISSRQQ